MRRHLILFFWALFFLASCKDNKPSDIIEKDQMARMLTDVHLIDGAITSHAVKDSLYKYGTHRYGLLFKKYGVDSVLFNKSVKYYAARPEEMMEIYDSITVVLQYKNDSLGKVSAAIAEKEMKLLEAKSKAESKREGDSIRRNSINSAAEPIKLRLNKRSK